MTKTTRRLASVLFIPALIAALVGVVGGPPPAADGKVSGMVGFIVFFVAYAGLLAAPWWPLSGLKERSRFEKLESTAMIWLFLTLIPKVTWEFGWLFFHKAIIAAKGQAWSAIWWSYMEGGDKRYFTIDPGLLSLETASVFFGFVGLAALWQWYRSGKRSIACLYIFLLIMSSDFWGFYFYLMTEVYAGFPSVATPADLLIKFALTNAYWMVMPWVFAVWAMQKLRQLHRAGT
jgi:hypothetical protein